MLGLHEKGLLRQAPVFGQEAHTFLWLMLASGGDPRIWLDPVTRRNRYGMKTTPAPDELSFASTTANTISAQGYAAAALAAGGLFPSGRALHLPLSQWFDEIRASVVNGLGVPGAEAVLAASGTDAEILAVALATGLAPRPLTNILIAPEETGSGVPLAAAGRHFSDCTALGVPVAAGSPIEGLALRGIEIVFVPIRDASGRARDPAAVDEEATAAVERELRKGRDVLLHVLDTSKTGLAGLTREAARFLMASAPGRVRVAVDACQLRCRLTQVKRDLEDGFMVIATGSKFAGGPPFCAVVLLPAALAAEIAAGPPLPRGLASYSAALDWPAALRDRSGDMALSHSNSGLGLRWAAALDGIETMAGFSAESETAIASRFASEVRARAQTLSGVVLHEDDALCACNTIVPLTVLDRNGAFAALSGAQKLHAALREAEHAPICHVGQAVRLGARTVLRVAASAYTVAGVAACMGGGLDRAFRSVACDLDSLFEKWSFIERQRQSE
jgi:hypothetical protein